MPRKRPPAPVIRDRIRELRRVRAAELVPHPNNWRTHPASQRAALRGLLADVGYADALLARELPDGRLQLIDGHLRAETTPEVEVPVLVLDLDEEEADKLLVTLDPLAGIAGVDSAQLDELLARVQFVDTQIIDALAAEWDRAVDELLRDSPAATSAPVESATHDLSAAANREALCSRYCVLIDCETETDQLNLLQRLNAEGLSCRALIA